MLYTHLKVTLTGKIKARLGRFIYLLSMLLEKELKAIQGSETKRFMTMTLGVIGLPQTKYYDMG